MPQNNDNDMREFAARYTAAWCSRDAAGVAAFFAPDGSLRDNDDPVQKGRNAITESAQSFMTAFPDLTLYLNDLVETNGKFIYMWTLDGTHRTTGRHVRIDGSEVWKMGNDGLVAESIGSFDAADFRRQAGLP
jgi:uncharacterized protein (TIGR02246 family)